ncbi:hypothetical protein CPJCM30710_06410 [Clostridium polyendosporum]|uniref:YggT family protein n=1 Tax=Clostridium polyendosporum TaxID=69208 RepID=A0A919VF21_9CLOT|nr:hypothetical protein CPJCM30710_06410 [Clostridium polyendosporum]
MILALVFMSKPNKVLYFIRLITEPILSPFKKIQQKLIPNVPVDFSPFFALVTLNIVEKLIYSIL